MTFEAKGLTKNFADKQVLQGISLQTQGGKALGLLGRNGAGKTTTIRIIMGVFPADSGEILIDGQPIRRERINFGYLPEERGLYPKKIISEQLLYLAELRGSSKKAALSAMDHWLQRLEMGAYKNKKLDTLSKGNQQKIQLVATLISNPDFVILDEPFSGLDPVNAMLLKDVVHELIDDGKIVLFSSHQMSYVEEFCDDIAILHQGRIVLSGNISPITATKLLWTAKTPRKSLHIPANNCRSWSRRVPRKAPTPSLHSGRRSRRTACLPPWQARPST